MTGEGTGKRLTTKDVAEIKRLAEEGANRKYIAEKMGVCEKTLCRYLGPTRTVTKITEDMVLKMHDLRDKHNLSNAQIGLELGIASSTVAGYLGPQKAGCRSPYGSLVAHADGESFVPKEKEEPMPEFLPLSKRVEMEESNTTTPDPAKKEPVLTLEREDWTKCFKGKKHTYTLTFERDELWLSVKDLNGSGVSMNGENVEDFIKELLALLDYIPQK